MNQLDLLGRSLTPADLAALEKSWIDPPTAYLALLRRVSDEEGRTFVGGTGSRAGILFPYYWPGETRSRQERIRRDLPEITYDRDQKPKEVGKYLAAPGARNMLYFVPSTRPEWLENTDLPIVITEGEKKTLALWRLAWHNLPDGAEHPRFLPVGLSGIWNWRGKVGREEAPNGGFQDVKGPIPDLDRIEWAGRRVTIVFDADVWTNQKIKDARGAFAAHLTHERHAEVFYAAPPKMKGEDSPKGIDDLLAVQGPERVLTRIEEARPAKVAKPDSSAAAEDELYADVEFFQTSDQKLFASVPEGDHREVWAISSRGFKSWLMRKIAKRDEKAPSQNAIADAINHCISQADMQPSSGEVFLRAASTEGRVFLDLANAAWECIEVNAGGWQLANDPPIRFRRPRGFQAHPSPMPQGALGVLRAFTNAEDDHTFILLTSWMLGAMMPKGPYPILIVQGEQGSAKSTTCRVLRRLVDPAKPDIRALPKDERDLMVAAANNWVMCYDNMSGCPQWLSDSLCRLSTGGGFATRELHSDAEEALFEASRPILVNGIDEIAGQADLIDRSLIVTLPVIPEDKRLPLEEFWSAFERVRPRLTGALLTAVAAALKHVDGVKLDRYPRMADFTRWVCAAAKGGALPFTAAQFIDAYAANRKESVLGSIESTPIAQALERLIRDDGEWEGTAAELLDRLNKDASDESKKQKAWPKDVRTVGNKVRRCAPVLRQAGIEIVFRRQDHGTRRTIKISGSKNTGQNDVTLVHPDVKSF